MPSTTAKIPRLASAIKRSSLRERTRPWSVAAPNLRIIRRMYRTKGTGESGARPRRETASERSPRQSSFAPLQLFSQHFEVSARGTLDEPQHVRRLTHLDEVAFIERVPRLAIVGDEHVLRLSVRVRAHFDNGAARNDDGTIG